MVRSTRKWWKRILIVLLVLILGSAAVRLYKGIAFKMLLNRTWEQERKVCNVYMQQPKQVEGITLSWNDMEDQRYVTLDTGSEQVYLHDNHLYFTNGNGYDLNGFLADVTIPKDLIRNLMILISPRQYYDGGYDAWSIEFPEEPNWLIRTLLPEVVGYWDLLRPLEVKFYGEQNNLRYILILHKNLYVYLELTDDPPTPIPTDLLMQMGTKPLPDIRTLEPLVLACKDLNQPGTVLADVSIRVDCGPLPIQDTGKIRFSPEGLYFARGDQWTELTPESAEREELLLGLGWMLIRDGVWEPGGTDSGVFSLSIPAEQLRSSLFSILPELEGLSLTLDDGSLSVRVEDGQFTALELICTGQMPFLITTIPLSIQVVLSMTG